MQVSRPFCPLAVVFLVSRFPVYAQPKTSGSRYDAQVPQDVDKALRSKPQYNRIKATTEDQVVTLSGDANLYMDKGNLTHRVEKIKDVEAMRDHVQVVCSVPGDQLRHTLADRLRYDRVGFGIAFNAVSLTVVNGVATLSGVVHDYPSRDSALAIVETTPGVKDVVDNIDVPPTSSVDDDPRARVYRAIYCVVNNDADKNNTGVRAQQVSGVFNVDNQLLALNQTNR